jgi:hypothetical protein
MTRNVRLYLDEFGQQSLDRLMDEGEGSPAGAFRTAALYYLSQRDSARPAWRAPRFRSKASPASPGLRVAFDDDTWAALEEEADRQNVETPELAVHALVYFLVDFEDGRVADVLEQALDPDE